MLRFSVQLENNQVKALVDGIAATVPIDPTDARAQRRLNVILSAELTKVLKSHFLARDKIPNKLGGTRTHFWARIARNTFPGSPRPDTGSAVVKGQENASLNPAAFLAHKVTGGTIRARRTKYLTIPVDALAHGIRASVLQDRIGRKLFLLTKNQLTLAASIDGQLRVFYVLKKSVNQKPDLKALPEPTTVEKAINTALDRLLPRVT